MPQKPYPNFILEVQRNTHKKYNSLHKCNLELKAAFNHFYELKTISTYALEPAIKAKKKIRKKNVFVVHKYQIIENLDTHVKSN